MSRVKLEEMHNCKSDCTFNCKVLRLFLFVSQITLVVDALRWWLNTGLNSEDLYIFKFLTIDPR